MEDTQLKKLVGEDHIKSIEKLLGLYYEPINARQSQEQRENLEEPLWLNRTVFLKNRQVVVKLKQHTASLNRHEKSKTVALLASFTKKIITMNEEKKYRVDFSEIGFMLEPLSKIITSKETRKAHLKIATSILVTLMMRSNDNDICKLAIKLFVDKTITIELKDLLEGQENTDTNVIKLELSNSNLRKCFFIDFTGANFTRVTIDKIDFSGLDLSSVKAEEVSANGCILDFCCLEESIFEFAILNNAKFRGSLLSNCNFKNATANHANFQKCMLFQTNFKDAKLRDSFFNDSFLFESCFDNTQCKGATFAQADVKGSTFKHARLKNTNFVDAKNLTAKQLLSAMIIDGANLCNFDYLDEKKLQEKAKVLSFETKELQRETNYTEIFNSIDAECETDDIGYSMFWPDVIDPGWHAPKQWCNLKNGSRVISLDPQSTLYQLIAEYVYSTSDVISAESTFCEWARMKKSYKKSWGMLADKIIKELVVGPPRHVGRPGSIEITRIQLLHDPTQWKRYRDYRSSLKKGIKQYENKPLSCVTWHILHGTEKFPILDEDCGEALLFTGTSFENMQKITRGGFKIFDKGPTAGAGYGALGNGLYFSDVFAKSSTYVPCPKCKDQQCDCEEPEEKCISLSRTALGKIYPDPKKTRKFEKTPKKGYQSSWGPYNEIHQSSGFDHNEFCIYNVEQVYPEYCIFYKNKVVNVQILDYDKIKDQTKIPHPSQLNNLIPSPIHELLLAYYPLVMPNNRYRRLQLLYKLLFKMNEHAHQESDIQVRDVLNELVYLIQDELSILSSKPLDNESHQLMTKHYEVFEYGLAKYKQWAKIIVLSRQAQSIHTKEASHYFYCSVAHLKKKNYNNMVTYMLVAFKLDKKWTNKMLNSNLFFNIKEFYFASVIQLTQNEKHHNNNMWIESIASWFGVRVLKKPLMINEWEEIYFTVPEKFREIWSRTLYRQLKNNVKPDDESLKRLNNIIYTGNQKKGVREKSLIWEKRIASLTDIENSKNNIEIYWLTREGSVVCSKLREDVVEQIFNEDGALNEDGIKTDGRSWVKCLTKTESGSVEEIAYIKLFPRYPTRQIISDLLLEQLSGNSVMATIGKIKHPKLKVAIPIILTKPSGHTFIDYYANNNVSNLAEIESQMDDYNVFWQFIESITLSNFDEKGDNVCLAKAVYGDQVYYKSLIIDSEEVFEPLSIVKNKLRYNSVILLTSLMDGKINRAAMKHFLSLDIYEIITRWKENILLITRNLIGEDECLFSEDEIEDYSLLTEKQKNGHFNVKYNQASTINGILKESEPAQIYQRLLQLQNTLNDVVGEYDNKLKEITPFYVLSKYDRALYVYYKDAFEIGDSACRRFESLPGVLENFHHSRVLVYRKEDRRTVVDDMVVYQSKMQYVTRAPTLFGRQVKKANSSMGVFDDIEKQFKGIKGLHDESSQFFSLYNEIHKHSSISGLSMSQNRIAKEKIINQLRWEYLQEKSTNFSNILLEEIAKQCLSILVLRKCRVTYAQFNDILVGNNQLKKLALVSVTINSTEDQRCITVSYKRNPYITELVIQDCNIEKLHVQYSSAYIGKIVINKCKDLTSIIVEATRIKKLIAERNDLLETLSLMVEQIEKTSFANRSLEQIIINGVSVRVAQLTLEKLEFLPLKCIQDSLHKGIEDFTKLTKPENRAIVLNGSDRLGLKPIAWNKLDAEIVNKLLLTLRFQTLHTLNVENCDAKSDDIYEILYNNKHLEELSLLNCKNIDDGIGMAVHYASSLKILRLERLPGLQKFYIDHNQTIRKVLHIVTFKSILPAKQPSACLEECYITGCENLVSYHFISDSTRVFKLVLDNNPKLTEFVHVQNTIHEISFIKTPIAKDVVNSFENKTDLQTVRCDSATQNDLAVIFLRDSYYDNRNIFTLLPFIINNSKQLDITGISCKNLIVNAYPLYLVSKLINKSSFLDSTMPLLTLLSHLPYLKEIEYVNAASIDRNQISNCITIRINSDVANINEKILQYVVRPNQALVAISKFMDIIYFKREIVGSRTLQTYKIFLNEQLFNKQDSGFVDYYISPTCSFVFTAKELSIIDVAGEKNAKVKIEYSWWKKWHLSEELSFNDDPGMSNTITTFTQGECSFTKILHTCSDYFMLMISSKDKQPAGYFIYDTKKNSAYISFPNSQTEKRELKLPEIPFDDLVVCNRRWSCGVITYAVKVAYYVITNNEGKISKVKCLPIRIKDKITISMSDLNNRIFFGTSNGKIIIISPSFKEPKIINTGNKTSIISMCLFNQHELIIGYKDGCIALQKIDTQKSKATTIYNLNHEINDMMITYDGVLLVSSNKQVYELNFTTRIINVSQLTKYKVEIRALRKKPKNYTRHDVHAYLASPNALMEVSKGQWKGLEKLMDYLMIPIHRETPLSFRFFTSEVVCDLLIQYLSKIQDTNSQAIIQHIGNFGLFHVKQSSGNEAESFKQVRFKQEP